MALDNLICHECGASLTRSHTACPQCGSAVSPARTGAEIVPCPSCGHGNRSGGNFCEACGAALPREEKAVATKVPPGQGKRKAARGASAGKRRTLASSPHIPALVLVLALVGWFVYDELSRSPVKHEHDQPPPRPALDAREQSEIDRQQSIVDSNPEDQESLLKLANLLQDHATHNPELLPRAISAYRKYLEANPGAENPRVDLGICLFESAKMDTTRTSQLIHMSLKEMESVFEKNPKHQAAAFNLGIVSLNAGLAVESVEWFRKAAAINPQSDLGKRAQLLLEQHSFTEPVN